MSRGRVGKLTAGAGVLALAVVFTTWGALAGAEAAVRHFTVAQPPVWHALAADGTAESSAVTVVAAEVGPASKLPAIAGLGATQSYFYVALYPTYPLSNAPQVPITIPTATSVSLVTPTGRVAGVVTPSNSMGTITSWYFPVSDTVTEATLDVGSFTVLVPNVAGDWTPWTFSPTPITFTGPLSANGTSHAAPPRTSSVSAGRGRHAGEQGSNQATGANRRPAPAGSATPVGLVVGAGIGGLVALGVATAAAVS